MFYNILSQTVMSTHVPALCNICTSFLKLNVYIRNALMFNHDLLIYKKHKQDSVSTMIIQVYYCLDGCRVLSLDSRLLNSEWIVDKLVWNVP